MARDPRSINDLSRITDSVLKPRQMPGSRRGRFLIVFAVFLVVEAAFVVSLMTQGQPIGMGGALWALWLLACVAWLFVPQLGAANDAPGNQRIARGVLFLALMIGLVVGAIGSAGVFVLPGWWTIVATSCAVGAAALLLGVLELRTRPED